MDCAYGRDSWLRNKIEGQGIVYIADIPCNLQVWLKEPKVGVPKRKNGRGRNPTRKQVLEQPLPF